MVQKKHYAKTENFREAQAKFRHLRDYVNRISSQYGMPEFRVELTRDLREIAHPNIIYPVGDPIFIHIFEENGEITYNVIEPVLTQEEEDIYNSVLDRIIEVAHTAKVPSSKDELRDIIISLYEDVIQIRYPPEKPGLLNKLGKRIGVDEVQYHNILFELIKDRLGYGKLEPLLRDIYIEDISCTGVGSVYIVHKIFGNLRTNLVFKNDIELNKYIVESSERVDRPVSEARPVVDAIMPDGSRVNFIYTRKISLEGSSFTIRKFNEKPISVPMLINWGTWSSEIGAYIWLCLENSISIFVCGETASGKTTTLNAMSSFIPNDNKVYSVEQTPEITLPHPVWQHLITRESGQDTDVTMFGLLLSALRSRPDYVIVGEIRGKEASITFQAMQTGHPVVSTFHAGSVHSMIQRLTGDPINVPIAFIDNLNVVMIQCAVFVNGNTERRVLSVSEILRYSDEAGKVLTKEVFIWNQGSDKHRFRGLYNSYVLENKVATMRGMSDSRKIYDVMKERARVLDKMVKNEVFDYFEVVKLLEKYRREGERGLPF